MVEERVSRIKRFGTAKSGGVSQEERLSENGKRSVQAASFDLLLWREPMKCHLMSSGSYLTVRDCLIYAQVCLTHSSSLVYHLLNIVLPEMTVAGIVKSFDVRRGL